MTSKCEEEAKGRNRYGQANLALAAAVFGLVASFPFSGTFIGGLVNSGCQAAMVGGLADWFAVTALFRKPLGIPFRTALIPRNRERIFRDLVDMVENQFLTPENIMQELGRYDFSTLLLEYLEDRGGKEDIKRIVRKIGGELLQKLDPQGLAELADTLVRQKAVHFRAAPLLAQGIEWSLHTGYGEKAADQLLLEVESLLRHPEMTAFLATVAGEILRRYEQEQTRRRLVSSLLQLSPDNLAILVQETMLETLALMQHPEHPWRKELIRQVQLAGERLRTDPAVQEQVEGWKVEALGKLDIRSVLTDFFQFIRGAEGSSGVGEALRMLKWVGNQVDDRIHAFKASPEQRRQFDIAAKRLLEDLIRRHHRQIGITVHSVLERYTDAMLVAFVEEKVGDDLQMIRINGSVVGGLAGMLIYLASWLLFHSG